MGAEVTMSEWEEMFCRWMVGGSEGLFYCVYVLLRSFGRSSGFVLQNVLVRWFSFAESHSVTPTSDQTPGFSPHLMPQLVDSWSLIHEPKSRYQNLPQCPALVVQVFGFLELSRSYFLAGSVRHVKSHRCIKSYMWGGAADSGHKRCRDAHRWRF